MATDASVDFPNVVNGERPVVATNVGLVLPAGIERKVGYWRRHREGNDPRPVIIELHPSDEVPADFEKYVHLNGSGTKFVLGYDAKMSAEAGTAAGSFLTGEWRDIDGCICRGMRLKTDAAFVVQVEPTEKK